jgi:hypothetical protein
MKPYVFGSALIQKVAGCGARRTLPSPPDSLDRVTGKSDTPVTNGRFGGALQHTKQIRAVALRASENQLIFPDRSPLKNGGAFDLSNAGIR